MKYISNQPSIFTRHSFSPFLLLGVFFIVIISSCSKDGSKEGQIPGDEPQVADTPLLILRPSSETGITFQNTINETFEMNITTHINTSNGGGVAVLDADKDGLQDLYFISSSGENKLYRNQGN